MRAGLSWKRPALLTVGVFLGLSLVPARELSSEERVRAQEAIERVAWAHRIWPADNPGPKPPLEALLPHEALRAKVADYLKKSNVLETRWGRTITAESLKAELERMTSRTRDPQRLREIFEALGNDPYLIAETLVRETLVDRWVREAYARDPALHAHVREEAEEGRRRCGTIACMASMGGEVIEDTWTRRTVSSPSARVTSDGAVRLEDDEWSLRSQDLAGAL